MLAVLYTYKHALLKPEVTRADNKVVKGFQRFQELQPSSLDLCILGQGCWRIDRE